MKWMIIALFLLQLVGYAGLLLLYMRVEKLQREGAHQERRHREMSEQMTAYLMELKEENDRFIAALSREEQAQSAPPSPPASPVPPPAPSLGRSAVSGASARTRYAAASALSAERPPAMESKEEAVLRLHADGQPPSQIARDLTMGQTEVELLLKFNK